MNDTKIFGQKAVTGIASGQGAKHLKDAGLTVRKFFERLRITNDHVGEIGRIKISIITLQENAAHLFDHTVKNCRSASGR